MNRDLYTETLELLKSDRRPLREIADGAEVNYHWLGKFKQEKFSNPGVRTIQKLHAFLSSQVAA